MNNNYSLDELTRQMNGFAEKYRVMLSARESGTPFPKARIFGLREELENFKAMLDKEHIVDIELCSYHAVISNAVNSVIASGDYV